MKKVYSPFEFVRANKKRKNGISPFLVAMVALTSFLVFSCQKDDLPDFSVEINDYILSMPPVMFPSEKTATVDSTDTEQDQEYDYTISYYSAAAGYDEQIVLNPQTDVIYPGALIKGESILDGSYLPISSKT